MLQRTNFINTIIALQRTQLNLVHSSKGGQTPSSR